MDIAKHSGDIPADRIRIACKAPVRPEGRYVLYWMIAARRTRWNFALQRAADLAESLGRPLLVFEPLRAGYRWASDRVHQYVAEGMRDQAARLSEAGVSYYPYLEPEPGAASGLLPTLAAEACAVVTDEFPCFFLPRMVGEAARRCPVRMEAVDGNGLLPLQAGWRAFPTAHSFRRHLQRELPGHLSATPAPDPLRERRSAPMALPAGVTRRWPPADLEAVATSGAWRASLPIDHTVHPIEERGGELAAGRALERFLEHRLDRYAEDRNAPDLEATSELSGYLHFGHLSSHEVVHRVLERESWTPQSLAASTDGKRSGWWGLSSSAEGFLDQIVTWRELGFQFCAARSDYDRYDSLPDWARATLADHAGDERPWLYGLAEFEEARTHDPLWNAAQRQLRREGRIHNYLRMLWGKKILHWSRSPEEALAILIELNNKYGIDGRDPNSYSGIFWCLGRFDRAWGPERPVFGKIRYMTSENTARKWPVRAYLERYGSESETTRLS